jgi:hypothetical protein
MGAILTVKNQEALKKKLTSLKEKRRKLSVEIELTNDLLTTSLKYESLEQSKKAIKACPWKDNEYGKCISCDCRRDLLADGKRYYTHWILEHDYLTNLHSSDPGR